MKDESTRRRERANGSESTRQLERARRNESTPWAERAMCRESTKNLERAMETESTTIAERASMNESTKPAERTTRAELRLQPNKITIEANLKLFSLDQGQSNGTAVTIEFDVPGDMDLDYVREQVWREKERLDVLVATMELARGNYTRTAYDEWRARHKKAYDSLLKRNKGPKE